jgi:hypothetical protein
MRRTVCLSILILACIYYVELGSSVSVVCGYILDDRGSIPRQIIFPLASASRPALRPTQPPVQCLLGFLSPWVKRGRDVTLITQPYLLPRSKTSRRYTSSLPWRLHGLAGRLYFTDYTHCVTLYYIYVYFCR